MPNKKSLSPEHRAMLKASAIIDDVIQERGYRTITSSRELEGLGFSAAQARQVPGLLLPLHSTDGQELPYVYRPDNPRVYEDKKGRRDKEGKYPTKVIKYEFRKGESMKLDCPPRSQKHLSDPSVPLWITEGQKKADALASLGLCAIDLLGVWNFIGKNSKGGKVVLSDWGDIALNDGRPVRLVFDSDVMRKVAVSKALDALKKFLQRKGAVVQVVYLPGPEKGVDDWLAAGHTHDDLCGLIEGPRPELKPAPTQFTFLEEAPVVLARPLTIAGEYAYAITWLPGQKEEREIKDKSGSIIHLTNPRITRERRRVVVRNDGTTFVDDDIAQADSLPISQLGLDVKAADVHTDDRVWSFQGVKHFKQGHRPDVKTVYLQLKEDVNRFMDFSYSFTDPDSIADLVTCYILHTWFLDALPSAGFLWVTGGPGSGKSTLMLLIAQLSHLGEALSPSSSFATLRDVAGAGGLMGIDDAEHWADPKKTPPEIRQLILSGNRRGVVVRYKEPSPDGKGWVNAFVDAFCPRVFTAIARPDSTLSSRNIVLPLSRTDDEVRGNADPMNYDLWPHKPRVLRDQLWALALHHLPQIPTHVKAVSEAGVLVGRDLQPWVGVLTMAHWLEPEVPGLWQRLSNLAGQIYQDEREHLEVADFGRILVKALRNLCSKQDGSRDGWEVTSAQLVEEVKEIIEDSDLDMSTDYITTKRVGYQLGRLRIGESLSGRRPRAWLISKRALDRALKAHRLTNDEKGVPHSPNGNNGINGTNGANTTIKAIKFDTTPFIEQAPKI